MSATTTLAKPLPTGAIVGLVIGLVVAALILASGIVFLKRRARAANKKYQPKFSTQLPGQTTLYDPKTENPFLSDPFAPNPPAFGQATLAAQLAVVRQKTSDVLIPPSTVPNGDATQASATRSSTLGTQTQTNGHNNYQIKEGSLRAPPPAHTKVPMVNNVTVKDDAESRRLAYVARVRQEEARFDKPGVKMPPPDIYYASKSAIKAPQPAAKRRNSADYSVVFGRRTVPSVPQRAVDRWEEADLEERGIGIAL